MATSDVLGRFDRLDAIGSGSFGLVYRARDRRSGEIVAMKYILSYRNSSDDVVDPSDFDREVTALEACSGHRSIVQLHAHGRCKYFGEDVLVMEFVGPTLRQVMRRERRGRSLRSELEVRLLMRQLLAGARWMHRRGFMHRDLKPENILMDARGNLKICDLGLAHSTAEPPPYASNVGTLHYRAPEVLLGSTDYNELIDSWALGCIMAELLSGKNPFNGTTNVDQLTEIIDILGANDIKEWIGYNGQWLPTGCPGPGSFLRCLFPCPAEADITYRTPLSEAGFEVLSGLLRCNPEKRLSPAQALRHRWFKVSDSASLRHRRR
ncbi:hypothetical protein GUJ93_ZPchr0009g1401 [Zizania palustris]|uniref:[RNA-polymerase]-subunit kinase n=1 Tax=Zizania palustris TaxID=103762 RepID=A0A8J5V608_ZIZPA|nr:hypothetical protein GUJ93_ZPchr0009g1401 [Zizania palustris]